MVSIETDASPSWVGAVGLSFHELLAAAAAEYDNLKGRASALTRENQLLKEKLLVVSNSHAKAASEDAPSTYVPLTGHSESSGSAQVKTLCNMMRKKPAALTGGCPSEGGTLTADARDGETTAPPAPLRSGGKTGRTLAPSGDTDLEPHAAAGFPQRESFPEREPSIVETARSLATARESTLEDTDVDEMLSLHTGIDEQPTWPSHKLSVLGKRPQPASKPSRRSARTAAQDSKAPEPSVLTLGDKVVPAPSVHETGANTTLLDEPAAEPATDVLLSTEREAEQSFSRQFHAELVAELEAAGPQPVPPAAAPASPSPPREAEQAAFRDDEGAAAESNGKTEGTAQGRIIFLHPRGKLGSANPAASMVGLPCSYGNLDVGGAPSDIRGFLPRALAAGHSSAAYNQAASAKCDDDWMDWDGPAEAEDGDGASRAGDKRGSRQGVTRQRSDSCDTPRQPEMPSYQTPSSPELPP